MTKITDRDVIEALQMWDESQLGNSNRLVWHGMSASKATRITARKLIKMGFAVKDATDLTWDSDLRLTNTGRYIWEKVRTTDYPLMFVRDDEGNIIDVVVDHEEIDRIFIEGIR